MLVPCLGCSEVLNANFDAASDDPPKQKQPTGASCTPEIVPVEHAAPPGCVAKAAVEDVATPDDDDCDGLTGAHVWNTTFGGDFSLSGSRARVSSKDELLVATARAGARPMSGLALSQLQDESVEWTNGWSTNGILRSLSVSADDTSLLLGAFYSPIDFGNGNFDTGGYTRFAWATFDDSGALRGAQMLSGPSATNSTHGGDTLALSGNRFGIFASSYTDVALKGGGELSKGSLFLVVDRDAELLSSMAWSPREESASSPLVVWDGARGRCDEIFAIGTTIGDVDFGSATSISLHPPTGGAWLFVMKLEPTDGSNYRVSDAQLLVPVTGGDMHRLAIASDGTIVVAASVAEELGELALGGECSKYQPQNEEVLLARLGPDLECRESVILDSTIGPRQAVDLALDSNDNLLLLASEYGYVQLLKLTPELEPIWKRSPSSLSNAKFISGDFASVVVDREDNVLVAGECRAYPSLDGEDVSPKCTGDLDIGGGPMESNGSQFAVVYRP
jgi:hypothetical protein